MPLYYRHKNVILFILYFLFLWGGQISSALASRQTSMMNFYLIPLYFCFFSRALIWFLILRGMDLTRAYALTSANYIVIPLLARLFLGETPRMTHFLGGVLIASGIVLFGWGEQRRKSL